MKKLLGGIFMAIGILIAGASGLCSLVFLFSMGSGEFSSASLVLVFGGVPFIIGLALILTGKAILESAKRDEGG